MQTRDSCPRATAIRVRVIRASLRLSLEFDFSFLERGGVEGISHSTGVAFIMYHTIGTLEKSVRHTVVVTLLDFQIVSFLSEACLMKEIDVPKEYGASKSKHVFGNNIRTLSGRRQARRRGVYGSTYSSKCV